MPLSDRPPAGTRTHAIHATPTSALHGVALLLAAVLLMAVAVTAIDALAACPCPATTPAPPAIEHPVLISPLTSGDQR
ncbi:MAG: hypothetical protein JO285_06665 [Kutzneria sp.]|nr:hypothetical protein [Kutzneria sp.]